VRERAVQIEIEVAMTATWVNAIVMNGTAHAAVMPKSLR
jgi:hypothetical protein